MLKFVHCGDFHIGAVCRGLGAAQSEIRSAEIRASLTHVIDFCIEKSADILLICGDLFDIPSPLSSDVSFVKNEFSRIHETDIFISCGNHDFLCRGGIFERKSSFPSNVHIFPPVVHSFPFPDKGYCVSGASFSSNTVLPVTNFSVPDNSLINLLCLHGDITPGSYYNIISEDALSASNASYAAFGHIHDGYFFNCGDVPCAYSGTPEGHSFSDDGSTGFIYGEFSENGLKTTRVCLSKRKYIRTQINISDLQTNNRIIEEILKTISPENLYRIELTGVISPQSDFSKNYIEVKLRNSAFFVEISDKTLAAESTDDLFSEQSLRGYFAQELRTLTDDDKLFSDALRIGLNALSGRETGI